MRILLGLCAASALWLAVCYAAQIPFAMPKSPGHNRWTLPRNSSNAAIVLDRYSLALAHGQQRIFVFAAEFHPWRLPVPSLWRDVLQKIRAAGFNTVSIYTHWGLIQPNLDPASIDLSGVNDLDFFLTIAKGTGLFVIVRPGPYINAETTMGGMAPWTVNINATLRTDDFEWYAAWKPYIDAISKIVVKHQLVYDSSHSDRLEGGAVILVQADNEYKTGRAERAYMKQLVQAFKSSGVSVPITYNDPSRDSNFVDLVDLYGLDSYPQRFDCSHPETWVPLRDDYLQYHLETNPDQPFYIPEFQGGSYDPYGGPGYPACLQMTDAKFSRVANQALLAQRVTLLSVYMVYGGTNWGALAEPDVYTSYDYGAALTEERQTTPKYAEYKRQGSFISSFPDLAMAEQVEDGAGVRITYAANVDDPDASVNTTTLRTTVLQNPDTLSRFYIVRHEDSTSTQKTQFGLEVDTLGQKVELGAKLDKPIERLVGLNYLNGRDSHIIPVDQRLGDRIILHYSTANVFRVSTIDNVLAIDLDTEPDQLNHFSFQLTDKTDRVTRIRIFNTDSPSESEDEHITVSDDGRLVTGSLPVSTSQDAPAVNIVYTTAKGYYIAMHSASTNSMQRDFSAPARFSTESSAANTNSGRWKERFFGHSTDSVLVRNVDMLFNATYSSVKAPLDTLHLWGSTSAERIATLVAFPTLDAVYWNGDLVALEKNDVAAWIYIISIPGPVTGALTWKPPTMDLLTWTSKDSLPEICKSMPYDDSLWTHANKTTSFNPYANDPSVDTQGTVLFASEYGYHGNNILWRGTIDADQRVAEKLTDLSLTLQGGRFFAFSVWWNDLYLGSAEANSVQSAANRTFVIPASALASKSDKNVVTILQDHMGYDMEVGELPIGLRTSELRLGLEGVKLPRGIVKFSFPSLRIAKADEPHVTWKVQGNYRGEHAPDRTRRLFNEGGLHAEVQGWHLPGFDASNWTRLDLAEMQSRVMFHRTEFHLDVPSGHDFGFQFVFVVPEEAGKKRNFRAQIYVNGWQMGKYIHRLGPQTIFPVHSGILDHNGLNTLGVSVWNLGEDKSDFDPATMLELRVSHRMSGQSRDSYKLEAPSYSDLRAR